MSDAYMCECCEEFKEGSGEHVRIGLYQGKSGFSPTYDFKHKVELCESCTDDLFDAVGGVLNDD